MKLFNPSIQEQLHRLSRFEGESLGEIAIIGGGISGLVAAYELAQLGYRSVIFEASGRIGGRILTSHYGDQTGELGAMRIPHAHDYVLYYVALLGLELGRFVDQNGNGYYDIRDTLVRISEGKSLQSLFELSDYERALIEAHGLGGVLAQVGQQLLTAVSPNDIEHLYSGNFSDATQLAKTIDGTSFLEFLTQRVQSPGALALLSAVNAMRDLWHSSCTGVIREVVSKRHEGLKEVIRGMDALPNGLHSKLVGEYGHLVDIRLNTEVCSIRTTTSGVTLETRKEDKTEVVDFEYSLCTLPFTVLRRMQLAGLSSGKQMAIANYTYAESTKVTLNFKKRFWESQEGPIFGGASITDGIVVQSYYPSNHADGYTNLEIEPTANSDKSHIPVSIPHDLNLQALQQPPLQDPGPGVMLASYTWGNDARRLSALPPEARIELVKNYIKRYHDSADVETYFDGGDTMAWHEHRWSAGAFSRLAPRDLQLYYLDAIKPEDNLFFSGEHLSHEPGWMQGSLISTLASLEALLQAATIKRNVRDAIAQPAQHVKETTP